MKYEYNNPLKRLLTYQEEFESKKFSLEIIDCLKTYAFSVIEVKPSFE